MDLTQCSQTPNFPLSQNNNNKNNVLTVWIYLEICCIPLNLSIEQKEVGRNSFRRKALADESEGTGLFILSACLVILYYNQDTIVFRADVSTLGLGHLES